MSRTIRGLQLAAQRADTAEDIKDRIRRNTACDLGRADTHAKFPKLTADNADEAIRFQNDRIRYHYEVLRAR